MNDAAGDTAAPAEAAPHEQSCEDCDPKLLDKLKCHADGVKAENDYNQAKLKDLETARTSYDDARHKYVEARRAAKPKVEDDPAKDEPTSEIGKQVSKMLEQLRCLVDKPRVIDTIDEAFEEIRCKLEECYPGGCTFSDDCDFDEARGCHEDDIAARIADIQRRVDAAAAAFATLITEPAQIGTRVTALEAEVKKINDEMAKDSRTVDFAALYADALVAQYHQRTVFNGFRHANAYVDCLCRTLTCQLNGHAAIAHLKRREAVRKCHDDARTKRCEYLRDNTADAVMAEYCRIWDRRHHHHEGHDDHEGDGDHGDREDHGDRGDRGDRGDHGDRGDRGWRERREEGRRDGRPRLDF